MNLEDGYEGGAGMEEAVQLVQLLDREGGPISVVATAAATAAATTSTTTGTCTGARTASSNDWAPLVDLIGTCVCVCV